jgi:hypothetical protein
MSQHHPHPTLTLKERAEAPRSTATSSSSAPKFVRLAIRARYGRAGPFAVLPSACGNTTLNSILAGCSGGFSLRRNADQRGSPWILSKDFRHDLVKTAVAVLGRLVGRENVVELAVVGLRPQVRVCAGQRPSKAPTSSCNRNRGAQTKSLTTINCRNMICII